MRNCVTCDAPVQPEWKFCIHCGTAIVRSVQDLAPDIPGAIRPEPATETRARILDRRLILGIVVVGLSIALVVYLAITSVGPGR